MEEDNQILELDFGNTPQKLRGGYLDMLEGNDNTNRFDESSDLSMTFLGRTDITRVSKIKVEEEILYLNKGIW